MAQRGVVAVIVAVIGTCGCQDMPGSSPLAPTSATDVTTVAASAGLEVAAGAPHITRGTLRTSTPGGHQVTLNWSAVADATGYVVEIGSAPGASDLGSIPRAVSEREYSWTVRPGATWARVKARRGDNTLSSPSNEISLLQEGGKTRLTVP